MFRLAAALAMVCLGAAAHAASEADRRDCASHQIADTKIAACTRIIEDQGSPTPLRDSGLPQSSDYLRQQEPARAGQSRFRCGAQAFARRSALALRPGTVVCHAGPIRPRHCRLFRTISNSTRATTGPSTSAGWPPAQRRASIRRWPTSTTRSRSIPPRPLARNNRALVFVRQGKLDAAIADYSEAIRLDPRFRLAYSNRGHAYEASGQYQQALADYRMARPRASRSRHRRKPARQGQGREGWPGSRP